MKNLIAQLKRHEGFRGAPYKDTVGKLTIGYGRNLDDVPLSEEEATQLLLNDIHAAETGLYAAYPNYRILDAARRDCLINMAFNLGIPRLRKFKRMHNALLHGDFKEAAYEMRSSKWAKQVGARAEELAQQMETGRH